MEEIRAPFPWTTAFKLARPCQHDPGDSDMQMLLVNNPSAHKDCSNVYPGKGTFSLLTLRALCLVGMSFYYLTSVIVTRAMSVLVHVDALS